MRTGANPADPELREPGGPALQKGSHKGKRPAPTVTQQEVINVLAAVPEHRIYRPTRDAWSYHECPADEWGPIWSVGAATVYAMERAGWLERCWTGAPDYTDHRRLTGAGKALARPCAVPVRA